MPNPNPRRPRPRILSVAALAAALLPAVAAAQPTADRILGGFEPTGDYVLELDGGDVPAAEVYHSETVGAFLVMAPGRLASPVLLSPRTAAVETLHAMKVVKKDDGAVEILPGAALSSQGTFQVDGEDVVFRVDGMRVVLKPRPYLLGPQTAAALTSHSPEYARGMAAYTPSGPLLEQLRAAPGQIKVEVYFGSWCPACKQLVPRILRVAQELGPSRIQWEFYGLPRPFGDEPRAKARGIDGVPTGVVFRDGKEVGRLTGGSWRIPELAIKNLLG